MSTRKSSIFYGTLIGLSSLVVGMVLASRLELTPASFARTAPLSVPAVNSAPLTGALDASTFRTIAHDQSPAVVSIIVSGKQAAPDVSEFFGFQFPFGNGNGDGNSSPNRRGGRGGGQMQQQPFRGAGSGFIIDGKAGYILTNNHVVENADEITVMLSNAKYEDEDGLSAKVVGRDRLTDSALIQLTDTPKQALPEVKFGDSNQIAPGDWVMAIGNPFQLPSTVTVGVVSAVGRVQQELNPMTGRDLEYIQTDAAINKGNSGGPLMNIRGEVVGMNTAIISPGGEGNIGIGFAVPIDTVREVLPQLRSGHVVRGRIGVRLRGTPLTATEAKDFGLTSTAGALVQVVDSDGPAKAAGIHAGDIIVEYNGKLVKTNQDLISAVSGTAPGTSTPLKVMRAGKPVALSVKVEELPVDADQPVVRAAERSRPAEPARPTDTGFGMTVEPLTGAVARQTGAPAGKGGAIVSDVSPLSAAARGGMAPGDVILSVNDKDVSSVAEVTKALDGVQTGHTARMLVWHPQDRTEEYLTLLKR